MKIQLYQIKAENLSVFARIGHLPEERILGQRIYLDIHCVLDQSKFSFTEALESVYNYENLCQIVMDLTLKQEFNLLETLAKEIAKIVLEDSRVLKIDITIRKVSVPISAILDSMTLNMSFTND